MGVLGKLGRLLILWAVVWGGFAMMNRPDIYDVRGLGGGGLYTEGRDDGDDGTDETFVPLKWLRARLSSAHHDRETRQGGGDG